MMYLICEDVYEKEIVRIQTAEDVEKNDLVVYFSYESPSLAKVIKFVDELEAITSDYNFIEPIKVVSTKTYFEKKAKDIQKAKLVKLMKEQMDLQKLEDTLKKNSECNPVMAELFAKYKNL